MKMSLPFRPALFKIAGSSLLAAVAMVTTAMAQSQSQSFQQVAPKQPEKTTEGKVVNEAPPKPLSGHADNEVLVDRLKGIVVLSDPKQVHAKGVTSHNSVEPGDVALAKDPNFNAAVAPYIGQ